MSLVVLAVAVVAIVVLQVRTNAAKAKLRKDVTELLRKLAEWEVEVAE